MSDTKTGFANFKI